MDADEFLATQPVLPSLLEDVVAFVEVRSGHDNRSRGVISELRSLGVSIAPTLNKDVTHVVFQGGHVSTYKKAKQLMCSVVAVSWIEASKELGRKAPEEEHPPPGFEKYEDPHASRKIKVLKSMQPDFDDEKDDERLNALLAKIKKKSAKRSASTESEVSIDKLGKKRKSAVSDKKKTGSTATNLSRSLDSCTGQNENEERTEKSKKRREVSTGSRTTNTDKNCSPPKRTKRSSVKSAKSGSRSGDTSVPNCCKEAAREETETEETGENRVDTTAQKSFDEPFEFVMPKPVKNRKGSDNSKKAAAGVKEGGQSQASSSKILEPTARSDTLSTPDQKTKELQINSNEKVGQSRPLGFIENITREKGPKKVEAESKQTRRITGLADLNNTSSKIKESHPFVARVLEVLAKTRKPQIHLKSPWRRQTAPVERRQSPRLSALQKENGAFSSSADSDADERRVTQCSTVRKKIEPQRNVTLGSASAHMLKFWKAKAPKVTSPEVALLDISFGPSNVPEQRNSGLLTTTVNSSCKNGTPVQPLFETPSESINFELNDLDRSDSPILGTRVKRRLLSLSSNHSSTKSLPGVSRVQRTASTETGGLRSVATTTKTTSHQAKTKPSDENASYRTSTKSLPDVTPLQGASTETANLKISVATATKATSRQKKTKPSDQNESTLSSSAVNGSESDERRNESLETSKRLSRWRSKQKKKPTLVCTHLKGSDVQKVMKAVRTLGKFEFEDQVSERTTHLVASGPRRTINMLRAVVRGCWIIKDEWVYRSDKAGRWLSEEDFELTEFSPMVQKRRLQRQSSSGLGQWDLFSSVGPIFVSPASQPRPSDLKDLILLSGGTLCKTAEEAALVIGPVTKSSKSKNGRPRVAPVWILDCVQRGVQLSFSTPEYTGKT